MNRQKAVWVDRLEQSGKEYLRYVAQFPEAEIHHAPSPGEWTIHQVAAHVRDTEQHAFLARAQRIMSEVHPAVQNFDQDEWNRDHYDANEPFKKIVAEFRASRRKFILLLRKSKNKDWDNWAVHSAYGRISLDWLVMHSYHHTMEHIAQMGYLAENALLKALNT